MITIERIKNIAEDIIADDEWVNDSHELCKRIDNEFYDVDLSIHDSPTKGTVGVVYFYENKFKEEDNE